MTKREVIVWAWNAFKWKWEACGSFPNKREARARRKQLALAPQFCILQEAGHVPPIYDPHEGPGIYMWRPD